MKNIFAILLITFSVCGFSYSDSTTTEWDDYFIPGVGYKFYTPKNTPLLGTYSGIMTEFVIYAKAKTKKNATNYYHSKGPSRVKTYANLSIMSSNNSQAKDIFFANLGLNLSFETATKRKIMIPFFGIEIGGLFQRDFSSLHFTPMAGIQLISTKRVLFNVQTGYMYTTKHFDDYSGFTYSTSLDILLWN